MSLPPTHAGSPEALAAYPELSDGQLARLRAYGTRYRTLPLEGWEKFETAGIHYAATELEARGCAGQPVTVIGGANSAGQAALFLASSDRPVTLAIRGPDVSGRDLRRSTHAGRPGPTSTAPPEGALDRRRRRRVGLASDQ